MVGKWHKNKFIITSDNGNGKEIKELLKFLSTYSSKKETFTSIDFNNILPLPSNIKYTKTYEFGVTEYINWRLFHWGTIWNPADIIINIKNYKTCPYVYIEFKTMYGRCSDELIQVLCEKFNNLSFNYQGEDGLNNITDIIYTKGKLEYYKNRNIVEGECKNEKIAL